MESTELRDNAYYKTIFSLSMRRKAIYGIIKGYGGMSSFNIAEKMVLPINSITGRVRELAIMRLIEVGKSVENKKSHLDNVYWVVIPEDRREALLRSDRKAIKDNLESITKALNYNNDDFIKELLECEYIRIQNRLKLINL